MGKKMILRFACMSDLHFHEDSDREIRRFYKGIRDIYEYCEQSEEYKKLDALTLNGDFTNGGTYAQMKKVKNAVDECLIPGTPVLMTLASHEYFAGEEQAKKQFAEIFSKPVNTDMIVNGFHFIGVSTTKGCGFEEPQISFLREHLEAAAKEDRKKPIFVFQHPHISGTVYGSVNWGDNDIYPTLADYPQIVDFSGHSHAPVNDPRNIHQKHFTSVGTGSLSYFELDEFDMYYGTVPPVKDQAQCLIVEVFDDYSVKIMPYDILTGHFFPLVWDIETPWDPDSYVYTDERYKTNNFKPYFTSDAFIKTEKTGENTVKIEFSQAVTDNEYVDYYTVVIKEKETGCIVRSRSLWSEYYFYDMPKTLKLSIEGIEKGVDYIIEISACGFWYNKSEKPLKAEFGI